MDFEINSSEIIFECLKEHGKGKLFFRSDGLEFESQRAELRTKYLESHPETENEHREAIVRAAITPGMTRDEVIAGWGLLDEDTQTVFGHVTDDQRSGFGYFTGFAVGEAYAIYLRDEVVLGVRATDELVPPHELELTMRLAEEDSGLFYFYEGDDGRIRGSDREQYFMDWDSQHLHLYRVEVVVPRSLRNVEDRIKAKGLIREYEIALLRLGYDSKTAPDELRTQVALKILPYPARSESDEVEKSLLNVAPQAPTSAIPLPPSPLEPPDDPTSVPPEKWFAYLAFGHEQEVAFPCDDDRVELLKVEWIRERLFRIQQVPLFANGVSLYDLVEAEWRESDVMPWFKRVAEKSGLRTVRAFLTDLEREAAVRHFAKVNTASRGRYRYENAVLAFTIEEPALDAIAKEWLSYLPLTWMYTDTLSQDCDAV
jgi:hypothetical protein